MEKALIGAGCFWGIEKFYSEITGVIDTKVGYSGGNTNNPTYQDVCSGETNHAEVVLINYDESIISYEEIIKYFWECHDPTQLNQQGYDVGTQYRSVIYYFNDQQKNIAEKSRKSFQEKIQKNIMTKIYFAKQFYLAENYHQNYLKKRV
jgi:methionine-S-sulfoxide reductase